MQRIALITSQAFSLVNFRGPLIHDLVAAGLEVHALAPDYDEGLRQQVRELGATPVDYSLSRAGMNPLQDLRGLFSLWRVLRRIQPDITLAYFIKPVIYGTLAAWLARVPRRYALITGLGYAFVDTGRSPGARSKLLRWLATSLYRLALGRADLVFFQNDDDLQLFVQGGQVRTEQAHRVNGTGVDLEHWSIAPPITAPPTFLLAARLLREKGILEYVAAARQVRQQHPRARFILLGDTDPNPGSITAEKVQAWVDEGLLEWPGHVEVQPWLAQASVYVLPSFYREGVPRSTQEAMAMGRPVITTDAPGCRETVEHGRNGFLVPVRDAEALAQAILRFIEEPTLIETMGQESRRLAEERFDVHKINQHMMEVMEIPTTTAEQEVSHA